MVIIESLQQFDIFLIDFIASDSIVIPIFTDNTLHSLNNDISLLYIHTLSSNNIYVLPFNHSEALNLSISLLDKLRKSSKIKYTLQKKELLHAINLQNIVDISLVHYLQHNDELEVESSSIMNYFQQKYLNFKHTNRIVPIFKLYEYCVILEEIIRRNISDDTISSNAFDFLNNKTLPVLAKLEQPGLHIDTGAFTSFFGKQHQKHITKDNKVFTQYNPYTTTGRPSSRFGDINFNALNKTDGSRALFTSRFGNNGMMLLFDYDAYHLRLIAKLLDYDFPPTSVHEYLGKIYGVAEYDESKAITFKLLYGGITPEYMHIPFFAKVDTFVSNMWYNYLNDGYMESPISGRRLYSRNLIDMNPQKLFNYFIQMFESEYTVGVMEQLLEYTNSFESKIVLYTYDSLLVDYSMNDGKRFVIDFKNMMEQNGFPVKVKYGTNYNNVDRLYL